MTSILALFLVVLLSGFYQSGIQLSLRPDIIHPDHGNSDYDHDDYYEMEWERPPFPDEEGFNLTENKQPNVEKTIEKPNSIESITDLLSKSKVHTETSAMIAIREAINALSLNDPIDYRAANIENDKQYDVIKRHRRHLSSKLLLGSPYDSKDQASFSTSSSWKNDQSKNSTFVIKNIKNKKW